MLNRLKNLSFICGFTLILLMTGAAAHAAATCPRVGFTIVEAHSTPQTRALKAGPRTVFVHRDLLTTTADITELRLVHPHDGDPDDVSILVKFTPDVEENLIDATTNHSGIRLAFVFNDEIMLNIKWEGPYGMYPGGTQLSIPHGMKKAQRLQRAVQGCIPPGTNDRPLREP